MVVTYWAVFTLGRAIVGVASCGDRRAADGRHRGLHPADAGIRPVDPGDAAHGAVTAALLACQSASDRRGYWLVLALETRAAAAHDLCGPHSARHAGRCSRSITRAGARCSRTIDPWLAGIVIVVLTVSAPDLARRTRQVLAPQLSGCGRGASSPGKFGDLGWRADRHRSAAHAGLVILVVLAAGWPRPRPQRRR